MGNKSKHFHPPSKPHEQRIKSVLMLAFIVLMFVLVAVTAMGCKTGKAGFKFQSGPINAAANSLGSAKTRFDWVNRQGTLGETAWPKWMRPMAKEMQQQGASGLADMSAADLALGQTVGELNSAKTTAITWKERFDGAVASGAAALKTEQDRFCSFKQRTYAYIAAIWIGGFIALGVMLRAMAHYCGFGASKLLAIAGTLCFILSILGIFWLWLEAHWRLSDDKKVSDAVAARLMKLEGV